MLRRSHSATVLSAEPVARIYSEYGLNERQLTSAECASIICEGLLAHDAERVSQSISFLSSPTEPNMESWRRCQATSSTTAVWPLNMVMASRVRPAVGWELMFHKQIV